MVPATYSAASALLAVALVGCTVGIGGAKTTTSAAPVARSSAGSLEATPTGPTRSATRPVTLADARHCPMTIGHPVPRTMPWRDHLFGWNTAYGNGALWVGGLWEHGVVVMTRDNIDRQGRLEMKFGWYRLTSGYLKITGRRLDGPAPPATGLTSGYGLTGFNASAVIFPTEGCWQITGRAGRVALTFTTFVIKGHCDFDATPIRCVARRAHRG
jgi:hypothetical protein